MVNNRFAQIMIKEKADLKMKYYGEYAKEEVGGLIDFEIDGDKVIVNDVIILKQEASMGDFYLDNDAVAKYMEKLFVKDPKKMGRIRGWWHKHPITTWSGHDDSTFEDLKKFSKGLILGIVMTPPNNNYLIRLEIGKDQWIQFNTRNYSVIKAKKKIDKRKLRKICKKEIKRFVIEPKQTIKTNTYSGYSGYGYNGGWTSEPIKKDKQLGLSNMVEEPISEEEIKIINKKMKEAFGCREHGNCFDCAYVDSCMECFENHIQPIRERDYIDYSIGETIMFNTENDEKKRLGGDEYDRRFVY